MNTAGAAGTLRISVIIPAWRDAEHLAQLLPKLSAMDALAETIVVNASEDRSAEEVARQHGAIFLNCSAANRGAQMNAGVLLATGDVLLFHHADTDLASAHVEAIVQALRDETIIGGAFHRCFDSRHPHMLFLEWAARLLVRFGGTIYGDQSIFVRREVFLRLGGFAPIALMEDIEFSRRLRRAGRIVVLDPAVRSSARRHMQNGPWRTTMQNGFIILLYKLGVSPERLHRWYYGRLTQGAASPRAESRLDPAQSGRS